MTSQPTLHRLDRDVVIDHLRKRSFCTLATVSPAGHPHSAGVLYELVDESLWINLHASSRKGRNVAANGRIGVTVPVRRVPVGGPPSAIQFQAAAQLIDPADPVAASELEQGNLASITGHGELNHPDAIFLRIAVPDRIHTYGLGMSLLSLIRHPLDAAGLATRS